ncbi:MAG: UTP--glucose-1-phosphate uridylyltransferase [Clostridia bacterium]|nr:UTP--glucose-1-phosphate uridylyltransferase [Clostridia bacterium]
MGKVQGFGHNGPKGTYILNVKPKPKSLFEILCDNLKNAKEKYNVVIPWYIMTSRENNNETVEFFEKNNYFNYPKEAVKFFMQGELPMVDTEGKILLNEEGIIKEAADGHGGIFEAMFKNNVVKDMKQKGIEWIFIGPIDNPLAKMVDEILIGISKECGVLESGKSLVKSNPEEKVGVFCKKNGKPSVVEYTEITEEMANELDKNNNLVYGESHINCNMFNIRGLEIIGNQKLPYHSAFKKATYLDENGNIIKPEEPNAYKFESFIFDAFNKLEDMLIFRVKREEEFAPVKGKEGVDSAETSVELYNKYYGLD